MDLLLLFIPIIITILGIMTIYSSTRPVLELNQPRFYLKQSIWLVVALLGMAASIVIDYKKLFRPAFYLYGFGIVLLFITIIFGHEGMGAQRWIRFGPLSFQPSEVFRVLLIIGASRYLTTRRSPPGWGSVFTYGLLYLMLPFYFLYKQPDLGTALILFFIASALLLIKGLGRRKILVLALVSVIVLPLGGRIVWKGLKTYQKNRIVAFLDPSVDPRGIGYQIEQSKITIGSGRILGKGYLKGTQGPFRFLPEKHTDFIFSVFAEEWGFVGSVILLGLYSLIILRGLETAYYAKDPFGVFMSLGISAMFFFYLFINIGMTMGLLPVVGIPLPFFSYGGTALLSNFIAVGLLINIRMRRFELFY
ncbi:MAG: rod shape-determining protein RodA [Nitrospirae bacterium]|nr:MAG: rod shape-determining protein RodA [Nitrospirota bacterium]